MDLAIHVQFLSPFREDRTPSLKKSLPKSYFGSRAKDAKFPVDKEQLNLKPNVEGVLECRGRIQSDYPEYLPDSALYTVKLV